MNIRIRSYARNLMELATQENMIDDCFRDLLDINAELNANEELTRCITSDAYSNEEKKRKLQAMRSP